MFACNEICNEFSLVQQKTSHFSAQFCPSQPGTFSIVCLHCLCFGNGVCCWQFGELVLAWLLEAKFNQVTISDCVYNAATISNSGCMHNSGSPPALLLPSCLLLDVVWRDHALPHVGGGLLQFVKKVVVLPPPRMGWEMHLSLLEDPILF